ncbi:MAG TPA: hypothetical protein VHH11_03540, partial [Gammaproteobacteria bacterium]|nr:hypothetical protein [Gammaproteobacteria bacterium]
ADLDFLSAALASAVGEEDTPAASAPAPAAPPPPSPVDEFMDLFNLGPDAPLELIDDSSTPRTNEPRKTASRR